jgi:hypothetical protein
MVLHRPIELARVAVHVILAWVHTSGYGVWGSGVLLAPGLNAEQHGSVLIGALEVPQARQGGASEKYASQCNPRFIFAN